MSCHDMKSVSEQAAGIFVSDCEPPNQPESSRMQLKKRVSQLCGFMPAMLVAGLLLYAGLMASFDKPAADQTSTVCIPDKRPA